jgi:hypothetical protein
VQPILPQFFPLEWPPQRPLAFLRMAGIPEWGFRPRYGPQPLLGRPKGELFGAWYRALVVSGYARGCATPIIESRVTSDASSSSLMPSVPSGRRGITR